MTTQQRLSFDIFEEPRHYTSDTDEVILGVRVRAESDVAAAAFNRHAESQSVTISWSVSDGASSSEWTTWAKLGPYGQVAVKFIREGNVYVALQVDTNEYAEGRTPEEATAELAGALEEYHDFLRRQGSANLAADLLAHLQWLDEQLQRGQPLRRPRLAPNGSCTSTT